MSDSDFFIKRSEEILEEAGLEGLLDFSFNKLSAIKIIKVLYVLGIVLACLFCAISILTSITIGAGSFITSIIISPIAALVWILFLRVILEVIVVIFHIDKTLKKLAPPSEDTKEDEPMES